MNKLEEFEKALIKQDKIKKVDFKVGDTIKVYQKIKEGEKERIQVYEGIVIRKTRGGIRATFTVRKTSFGVGVEKTFQFYSPRILRIKVISRGEVRRSRLYYLRKLAGKSARIESELERGGEEESTKAMKEVTGEIPSPEKQPAKEKK